MKKLELTSQEEIKVLYLALHHYQRVMEDGLHKPFPASVSHDVIEKLLRGNQRYIEICSTLIDRLLNINR